MTYTPSEPIQQILNNLPTSSGVYQMVDKRGEIIYIGKAKNLRNRVRSYFQPSNTETKVLRIRERVTDIKILVMENEVAALTAEAQLIRAHKPRYNVIWKDDKRYPYIIVRTRDPFPKVEMTRRVNRKDGNRYFGPYGSAWEVRRILDSLRKAFPYLTCDRNITGKDDRACLYYDIKLCGAPCIGVQSKAEYRATLDKLMSVLSGKGDDIIKTMTTEMNDAAENLDFEKAALFRDRIASIQQATMRQHRISKIGVDQDVIAVARADKIAMMQLLLIRGGFLISTESFPLMNIEDISDAELVAGFIPQYYESTYEVPPEIIISEAIPDVDIIEVWLRERRDNRKVTFTVPQRGDKRKLVKRAIETAAEQLNLFQARWEKDTIRQETALKEIQDALKLPEPPNRIECYDISTFHGCINCRESGGFCSRHTCKK